MFSQNSSRFEKVLDALFLIGFLSLAWLYVVRPLGDLDFWWHLKTGEVMVHNRELLTFDPFAFTSDGVASIREKLILQGYWLWQVLFYSVYSVLGFSGITLLEGATLVSLLFVMVYRMHKERVPPAIAMLLLATGFFVFRMFFLERPQVVSFLFVAILLGMFEAIRRGSRPPWLLYPMMILWANCHAGFFFGDLLLALFCVGALWQYRKESVRLKSILLWATLGVIASLLSPTTYYVFVDLFDQSNKLAQSGIIEYQSTLWYFNYSDKIQMIMLWSLMLLNSYALFVNKKRYIPDMIIFLATAVLSLLYIRMIAFYVVAIIPTMAFYLSNIEVFNKKNVQILFKFFAILILILGLYDEIGHKNTHFFNNPEINKVNIPEKISVFILTQNIRGNMFNDYDWGGYFIWKLYPKVKVFFDGRCIDTKIYTDYKTIENAFKQKINGIECFRYILDKYKIDFVVQKHVTVYGGMQPLSKYLLNDPAWVPVYLDEQGYILVRKNSENADVVKNFGMGRLEFLRDLLKYYDNSILQYPNNANIYVTRADLLNYLGRYAAAEQDLERAKILMPSQPLIAQKIRELEALRRQSGAGR